MDLLIVKSTDQPFLQRVQECAAHDPSFSPPAEPGALLDRYTLTTRYPDALPFPAVPYEAFSASDSAQAPSAAERILAAARRGIGSS